MIQNTKKTKTTQKYTNEYKSASGYSSWVSMKQRCYNARSSAYKYYGGRGIRVCDRWIQSFENFFEDMGRKPDLSYSLERINVNGNYEPSNCKWGTKKEQDRNKRDSRIIEFEGKKKNVVDWGEITGLGMHTIRYRLDNGWSVEDALTTELRAMNVKVNQFTLEGTFIKQWDSVESTKEFGFLPSEVGRCCRKINSYHKGCKWEYAEQPKEEISDWLKENGKKTISIKAEELMIGNLIFFKGQKVKITAIGSDRIWYEEGSNEGNGLLFYCEPIPLSPEILKEYNFQDRPLDSQYLHSYIHSNSKVILNCYKENVSEFWLYPGLWEQTQKFKYLHQVQNLIHSLLLPEKQGQSWEDCYDKKQSLIWLTQNPEY